MLRYSKEEIRQLVHTPAELSSSYVQWAKDIKKNPGVRWGVPGIDKRVIPMRPGNVVFLIGRPGSGKTSVMAYLAKIEADRIREAKIKDEAVVYVSWEMAAEELLAAWMADDGMSASDVAWGRADIDALTYRAFKQADIPIWVIGHSINRVGQRTARMTPEVVFQAVESMKEDFGVRPRLLCLDYIQVIPIESNANRVERVNEIPPRIKELAKSIGAPIIAGAQARREVDKYKAKIPELSDGQWASSIEQAADKVFGLWRPVTTEDKREGDGYLTLSDGSDVEITDRLMLIRLLKQRFEKPRWTWVMEFAPEYVRLAEMEKQNYVGGNGKG
jgi:replicative DNA helicase